MAQKQVDKVLITAQVKCHSCSEKLDVILVYDPHSGACHPVDVSCECGILFDMKVTKMQYKFIK